MGHPKPGEGGLAYWMRYATPLILFAVAAGVWWYNQQHADRVLLFPFLDVVLPSLKGDPKAMGNASVLLFAALGTLSLLWRVVTRRRDEDEP